MVKVRRPQITLLASDHPRGLTALLCDHLHPQNLPYVTPLHHANILLIQGQERRSQNVTFLAPLVWIFSGGN
eukprot:1158358-Pelagomonas_calceolata.AAC.4